MKQYDLTYFSDPQTLRSLEPNLLLKLLRLYREPLERRGIQALSYLERKHPKRWCRRVDVTSGDEPLHQPTGILVVPEREPPPVRPSDG